ncbi:MULTISPECIES: cory-CC-star protein [Corynebacterium]|uniref:Cory-CC-star protein n=1 Tax=Corynebacterium pseudodiphtheriticum TaxID=37637 RepID=A0ABT7FV34_9CORY|nr:MULTISPECIES: cory-CC-star protein [Corynebacterium]ERS42209.1 hypothetical protein HMPREF1292_00283 [Corynebacterium sp. KPL1995]ERS75217.1 hypothetical protein HMPREF1290_00284 [Corynebacterium sp. KPL1989]MDC7110694.1 cory-CC-star protein [Corynebacterium pseudodiphtheriticum]MDC7114663.1 cory-CC-star protein [Corynebacterium pseudodiphtheriticum]MDK4289853.1 cory-CC-star protein [Corynebacterium pseudodiphtheriticum]
MSIVDKLKAFGQGLNEYYSAPYRATFARAQQEEDDLFQLLVMSEALGIPNPASFYTLELLPIIYEDFHAWHRRMGMLRSPLEEIQCC